MKVLLLKKFCLETQFFAFYFTFSLAWNFLYICNLSANSMTFLFLNFIFVLQSITLTQNSTMFWIFTRNFYKFFFFSNRVRVLPDPQICELYSRRLRNDRISVTAKISESIHTQYREKWSTPVFQFYNIFTFFLYLLFFLSFNFHHFENLPNRSKIFSC